MVAKPLKTKSKLPVSRHPLFAPMVALWFAALFGLGSLAIRPTLLESAILALRIDLVIPAAAPPLGFTFRILLALSLFVIGGAIGFVLARRLARPAGQQSAGFRFSKVKAAAQAAAPVAVDAYDEDEDDDFARLASARRIEDDAANANVIPGRRRALAMEEDFATEVHDLAPVPGHKPQILDLADLGAFDDAELPEPAEEEAAPVFTAEDVVTAEDGEPRFDPWRRHPNASPAVQVFVEDDAEADAPAQFTAPFAAPFAAPLQASETSADFSRPFAAGHAEAPAFAAPADFAAPSFAEPASFAPAPYSPFAAPAAFEAHDGGVEDGEFRDAANDEAEPVAEVEPLAGPEEEIASEPIAAFTPAPLDFLAPSEPAQQQPAASLPVFGAATGDAAERLVAMPLTSLGVVQLAERLALAIARKREVAPAPDAAPAVLPGLPASLAAPQPPVPVAFPLPPSLTPPPAMDFSAPAGPVEPVSEAEPEFEDEADIEAEAEVAVEAAEVPVEPDTAVTQLFGLSSALPAALRPLSFDDHADDESLPSILPPRGFPKLPEQIAAAQPEPVEDVATDEPGEEETYASLLEMKTPPRAFVRIEEPEEESASVEPVVIFPGQDSRHAFANGGSGFTSAPGEEIGRLFDAPPAPNAPLRMPPAVARSIDAEETERQLKAALATLQRMSGAA